MVEDFAKLEGKGNRYINFPARTEKDHPVEPHNNLMASSLLQAGVVQTKTFKLKTGETVSMKDLVKRVSERLPETRSDGRLCLDLQCSTSRRRKTEG